MSDHTHRYREMRYIALWGAVVNAFLGCVKIFFGWIGHSHALFADGIHSFSDLITDALVLFASPYGSEAADEAHPYGHERIETAATVLLSIVLCLAGLGIIYDALEHVYHRSVTLPAFYVLIVALSSIIANEILYHYTQHVAKKIKSELLKANAWHHRTDAASSIVVLLGAGGSLLGYPYFDAIAAVVVGLMVVKMGWNLGSSSFMELIDTGVNEDTLSSIREIIAGVPGVESVHQLRTRSMGGKILLDVHILVAPKLSVSEGHHIGQCVHFALMDELPEVHDVTVHIDPEDDEIEPPSRHLPFRTEVIESLKQRWAALLSLDAIEDIMLHYLHGEIHVDVVLSLELLNEYPSSDAISKQLQAVLVDLPEITRLKVYFT